MKKLITLLCAVLCFSVAKAQDLPNDLYSVTNAPFYSSYFSIANWPVFPPCPMNCWGETNALYYSPSWDAIFVDDTLSTYNHFTRNGIDPWEPGDPVDTNAVDNVTCTN